MAPFHVFLLPSGDSSRLVPVALVNDFHFWALKPIEENENKDEEFDVEYRCEDLAPWHDGEAASEMALVNCLSSWSPWNQPTITLIEAIQDLKGVLKGDIALCTKARQLAFAELHREDKAYDEACLVINFRLKF